MCMSVFVNKFELENVGMSSERERKLRHLSVNLIFQANQ